MVVVAMLLTGISFTSCDEKDNAIIINGKEWVKAEVIKTDDGATIVANTPSDISRMLMKVGADLKTAVEAGDDYVITIDAPSLESSEGDNIISIPLQNYLSLDPTSTAKVVVNFANQISTDVPLVIQAKGATGGSVPAENKVELNLPSGTSGVDLELYMPATSVTLNGGNIDELIATTASNTLNIESGVTVNWLMVKSGNAVVKDGGKVLGALRNSYTEITDKGVKINDLYKNEVPASPTADDYYYVDKVKILKQENGYLPWLYIYSYAEDPGNKAEIVIADGAKVFVYHGYNKYYPAVNIIGEGNAKIMADGSKDGDGKVYPDNSISITAIKSITNVTIDMTKCVVLNSETGEYEELEIEEDYDTYLYPPQNAKDCIMKATEFIGSYQSDINHYLNNCELSARLIQNINPNSENTTFKGNYISFSGNVSGNSATTKGCKFEGTENDHEIEVILPYQTADRTSFDYIFDSCQFGKGFMLSTDFVGSKPWIDKDGKPVTDGYFWYELDEDGYPKTDESGMYYLPQKYSTKLDDVPQANKDNGEGWNRGYYHRTSTTGLPIPAVYKDYKANIKFNNSTIDGKAITDKTDFIGNVAAGRDENGKIATTTRFVIGGVSYKAVKDSDTQKWFLVAAE